ncbi:hypothetical protein BU251_00465 [Candidatus Velamenicoccus archaeovorus]|uniref:Phosphatidylglycerol lysyltransferase C-terminal domain-containing protein n=1 Tax=Velamenicoccus archaeovorus TaxID=1930593 RepID=A0A410P2K8_VELA1|nr:phosphatidylglycerol lysyltransferase domain-containing protein [Candidatus Velamenicoccus archaeovorus]QAT16318.1 hypothetical protein BU251_00465 [Candidatus Velamenicoccus archaeovorus]
MIVDTKGTADIPFFPRLRPLRRDDKALLDRLFIAYPLTISEYTFTNLFAWRTSYDFCLSRLGETVLIVSRRRERLDIFDPLCPAAEKRKVVEQCLGSSAGAPVVFVRLPEETAVPLQASGRFAVKEERDHFDYLYRTSDLIGLKGAAYDGKRNFIKRFKETCAFEFIEMKREDVESCLSFQEEWCLAKDCQRTEGLAHEREAVEEILGNFEGLGVRGAMIRVGGKVEAVTIGEALNPRTFVIHIEKANDVCTGIYQAINQMFCAAAAAGFDFVNREQDLGVPGLRQAKESYKPCAMVKKYTLAGK